MFFGEIWMQVFQTVSSLMKKLFLADMSSVHVARVPHGESPPMGLLPRDPQQQLKSMLGTVQALSLSIFMKVKTDQVVVQSKRVSIQYDVVVTAIV